MDLLEKLEKEVDGSSYTNSDIYGFKVVRIVSKSRNKKECKHCGKKTDQIVMCISRMHRSCKNCEPACRRA